MGGVKGEGTLSLLHSTYPPLQRRERWRKGWSAGGSEGQS